MIRIGMMSFAHQHANAYIASLRAIPDVQVIGLADDDAERSQQTADRFNTRKFADYNALLSEALDGVVICSENSRHREMVEMALAAGVKHILCEKPLTTTLQDAQAVVKAVDVAGAQLMTAFSVRFSPPIREAKALIDGGKLGALYACNAINQGENPSHVRSWFVDKRLSGGGAMMDHTVHVVDVLRWILQSEITEIYTEAGNLFPVPGIDIDTAATSMITFANGAFVGLDCSWSRPAYYPTWGNLKIDFVGERGLIAVDIFAQKFTTYDHTVKRGNWDFWGTDIDQEMIREFAASIREGRAPLVTGYDGLKATEAVVAAYLSAETHEPVKLPLS